MTVAVGTEGGERCRYGIIWYHILYGNSAIEFAGHGNDPEKLESSLSSRKIGSPEQQKNNSTITKT